MNIIAQDELINIDILSIDVDWFKSIGRINQLRLLKIVDNHISNICAETVKEANDLRKPYVKVYNKLYKLVIRL